MTKEYSVPILVVLFLVFQTVVTLVTVIAGIVMVDAGTVTTGPSTVIVDPVTVTTTVDVAVRSPGDPQEVAAGQVGLTVTVVGASQLLPLIVTVVGAQVLLVVELALVVLVNVFDTGLVLALSVVLEVEDKELEVDEALVSEVLAKLVVEAVLVVVIVVPLELTMLVVELLLNVVVAVPVLELMEVSMDAEVELADIEVVELVCSGPTTTLLEVAVVEVDVVTSVKLTVFETLEVDSRLDSELVASALELVDAGRSVAVLVH